MDWTGGVRKRFAGGKNNSNTFKQKQHFAKARATLQYTPSSYRTFKPTYPAPESDGERRRQYLHEEAKSKRHSTHATGRGHTSRPSRGDHDNHPKQPGAHVDKVSKRQSHDDHSPSIDIGTLDDDKNDEELQLLASRHGLLARRDWLGLSFARPLRMDYASSTNRDHVGKRRKVRKAHRSLRPPSRRLLTPLFEERQLRPDYVMSGALRDDHIIVKIGTEALASQTQPSRRSRTPMNTSMRPPSTNFASLSEESMLLGAAGDESEAGRSIRNDDHQPSGSGEALQAPRNAARPQQLVADTAQMCRRTTMDPLPSENDDSMSSRELPDKRMPIQAPPADVWVDHSTNPASVLKTHISQSNARIANLNEPFDQIQKLPTSESNDRQWRQMMHIAPYTSSHVSLARVKSSGDHLATYSSSPRPALRRAVSQVVNTGSKTREDEFPNRAVATDAPKRLPSNVIDLPTPSLQEGRSSSLAEDAKDEAFWRRFIIGSEKSSDLLKGLIDGAKPRSDSDIVLAANASSSLATSGIGTSNNATAGGTLFETQTTSDDYLREHAAQARVHHEAIESVRPVSEHDSIEEKHDFLKPVKQPVNINATSNRMVNSCHYSRRRNTAVAAEPTTRHNYRLVGGGKTKRKRPRAHHEIYDVLDSDGNSFA
ncbi:hypothetical protein LTR78_006727 [Recurvomyces mirabilis]|uniref:Uncharacterized protein n=1 Tax=Recurvomyces mirabilis TaxID=574656 RepID=A0AAE1BZT0_9PEZI|nr:hypothetical protein LTR78_006727 [Recurvomyces mirabilis]KAK5151383.1 hypothetical protein LTS14_009226 [Recurvomyces mirabilis]